MFGLGTLETHTLPGDGIASTEVCTQCPGHADNGVVWVMRLEDLCLT